MSLPNPSNPVHIYVVDDEPLVGNLLEAVLSMSGYKSRAFTHPGRALEALREAAEKPHILVTDYAMPGMNGGELIQQCKMLQPDLKIVLISGNVDHQILHQLPVQPDWFLPKPFTVENLLNAIRDLGGCLLD